MCAVNAAGKDSGGTYAADIQILKDGGTEVATAIAVQVLAGDKHWRKTRITAGGVGSPCVESGAVCNCGDVTSRPYMYEYSLLWFRK